MSTVTSFNTRVGAVVSALGDYAASLVTNDSTVTGATVKDALNTLKASIVAAPVSSVFARVGAVVAAAGDYLTSQVTNDSTVLSAVGVVATTAKAALDRLNLVAFNPKVASPVFAIPFSNSVSVSTVGAQYISVGNAPTAVTIGSSGQPVLSHLRTTTAAAGVVSYAADGATACLPNNVSWRGAQTCRVATPSANWRWYNAFHGLYNPSNVDISTLLNCIGIGKADGLANVQLFHNDGAGAAVLQDLGASFPASTAGASYRLAVELDASTGTWSWTVTRLDVVASVSGSFTTDAPATPLQFACGCGNNTDASIVQLFWMGMRATVDY